MSSIPFVPVFSVELKAELKIPLLGFKKIIRMAITPVTKMIYSRVL
jgi:hypothetical protein